MRTDEFSKLDPTQQASLLVAMYIRNAIDDFHAQHLSDEQMAELNPIIRTAVYEALTVLRDDSPKAHRTKTYLLDMVPNYWEIPDTPPEEQAWNGDQWS